MRWIACVSSMAVASLVTLSLTAASTSAAQSGKAPHLLRIIDNLTLEEKVGQLFVTYVYGETADTTDPEAVARNQQDYGVDNAAELIEEYHLGGIIYYDWADNTASNDPHQIAELSNGIQEAALEQPSEIPLTITIDQEGGLIARVRAPATQFPDVMAIGASQRVPYAWLAARIGGRELRAMGINQNYAPVGDVNVNPANPVIGIRSFGADPHRVAEMTAAQVRGFQSQKVSATAKHFPGHGDTIADSHTEPPVITHTLEEWEELDMPPFQEAIEAGVDSIMTGHLIFPDLDPSQDPATLSEPIMTGLLRERLGYDGVVVTDALTMEGVREAYGDDRIPVLALQAGVDQLLYPPEGLFDLQYNAVLDAVAEGELTEERIDESVYRVLAQKLKRGLFRDPFANVSRIDAVVGSDAHLRWAERIAEPTTTLVANDDTVLPLEATPREIAVVGPQTGALAAEMADRGQQVTEVGTGLSPTQEDIDAAVAAAADADLAIVTTNQAWKINLPDDLQDPGNGPGQRDLARAVLATGTSTVHWAARDTYDIGFLPEIPTSVVSYSFQPIAVESLAKVLFGEVGPQGTLPVAIPDPQTGEVVYPLGHGLSYNG